MYKVIAADDEPMVRKALESLIDWKALNCQLEFVAPNGKELIEYAEKNQPDIVVTDIKMPEADGITVAKYFHENYSNTKVILLTAYADFSYAKQAISYNVVEYVSKTGDFDDVVAAVKKSIHQLEQERKNQAMLQNSSQVAQHYNHLAQHYSHLITQLSPSSQLLQEQRGGVDLVLETTQYIKQHIDEAITLNQIATYIGVNESYLSRVFKSRTGTSIKNRINTIKMEKAKELLANTNLKIYEIAMQLGLENTTYLSRLFHQYTGTTPMEYRNQNMKKTYSPDGG